MTCTRVLAALLAAAALAPAAAGCGLGTGRGPSGVSLTVSRDFGARRLGAASAPSVPKGETVLAFLERRFRVTTRGGGGAVQSIDGFAAGREGGRPVDWFLFVNGIRSPVGPRQAMLHPGDRIWWDRHDWGATGPSGTPAVVGAFPAPFDHDLSGKRPPVRLECAPGAAAACDRAAQRLQAIGVVPARAVLGTGAGVDTLRVLVGTWAAIRRDGAAAPLERGPAASGVYVRPDASGRTLALLDARGGVAQTLGPDGGLVASTRFEKQEPAWLVTGTDAAGTLAAASALEARALAHRFALALDGGRPVSAPAAP